MGGGGQAPCEPGEHPPPPHSPAFGGILGMEEWGGGMLLNPSLPAPALPQSGGDPRASKSAARESCQGPILPPPPPSIPLAPPPTYRDIPAQGKPTGECGQPGWGWGTVGQPPPPHGTTEGWGGGWEGVRAGGGALLWLPAPPPADLSKSHVTPSETLSQTNVTSVYRKTVVLKCHQPPRLHPPTPPKKKARYYPFGEGCPKSIVAQ